MIDSASQYDFVTDLSGVVIDGGIMPARDAAHNPTGIMQPKCLRGEDVAFLAECAGERNTVMSKQLQGTRAFDRRVSKQQLDDIRTSLIQYIKPPLSGEDCFYVMPQYQFTDERAAMQSSLTASMIRAQIPQLTYIYHDCCMSAVVSHAKTDKILYGDDIRDLFRDAKNTRQMVVDGNCNNLPVDGYRPHAHDNITQVNSTFTRTWHDYHYSGSDPGYTIDDMPDSMMFFQTGFTSLNPPRPSMPTGGFGQITYQPTTMEIKIQIAPQILHYVEKDLTAVVCVFSQHDVTEGIYDSGSGRLIYNYEYSYDLWGFPIETTRSNAGVVTLKWTDLEPIKNTLDDYTTNNFPEYYWHGQKVMSNRYEPILGIPLVLKLTDHTDFGSIPWS